MNKKSFFQDWVNALEGNETKSAVISAVLIAVLTFLGTYFLKLCAYVYWFFTFYRFNISMHYLKDAIIFTEGYQYLFIGVFPVIYLVYLLLKLIYKKCQKYFLIMRMKFLGEDISIVALPLVYKIAIVIFTLMVPFMIINEFTYSIGIKKRIWIIPIVLFCCYLPKILLYKNMFPDSTIPPKSKVKHITICCILIIYIILSTVGSSGLTYSLGFENRSFLSLRIIRGLDLKNDEIAVVPSVEEDVAVVLFETNDYYYVVRGIIAEYRSVDNSCQQLTVYSDEYALVEKNCQLIEKVTPVHSLYYGIKKIGENNSNLVYFYWAGVWVSISIITLILSKLR